MWISAGLAAQLLGVGFLRESRARRDRAALLAGAGIVLLVSSIGLMVQGLGPELGITWALVTVSLAAYVLILPPFFSARSVGHERVPKRLRAMPTPPSGSTVRLALRLVAAGPLYLIVALALSLLIATKPWASEVSRLFTGGLMTPVFWSLGALHATVDGSLKRVLTLPLGLTAAAAMVYVLI